MKRQTLLLILLIVSLATHFAFWGYPAEVVFDEVHFGLFSSQYLSGQYFFDIHPPLAKLLISGFGRLGDVDPATTFATIGKPFPDQGYLWLRFLPTIAGALLPLIIFLFCLELGLSRAAAFFAAVAVILENSLLVQSRFILLDSLLLLFGFLGLWLYFVFRRRPNLSYRYLWLAGAAFFLTAAISVKWTGLAFLGLAGLTELALFFSSPRPWPWRSLLKNLSFLVVIPALVYFWVFAVHFALLPRSGSGDAFMSPAFQKTLEGSRYANDEEVAPSSGEVRRFLELNRVMYEANGRIKVVHPYTSPWFSWPLLTRPIYYWNGKVAFATSTATTTVAGVANSREAKIYLLGNPAIYALSSGAILLLFLIFASNHSLIRRRPRFWLFLLIAYCANWLPFILITRQMFLYHYFSALIFAIIALAALCDQISSPRHRQQVLMGLGLVFLAFFLWFVPLTYGLPLSAELEKYFFWFSSWR